jgi:tetratricopeptide (TPR) repeat protein
VASRIRALQCVAATLLIVCTVLSSGALASPFLSVEIETALSDRAEFLRQAGLTDGDFLTLNSQTERSHAEIEGAILRLGRTGNVWHHYILGLIDDDGERAGALYGRALSAAGRDAGVLWLLGLEFIRYGELPWAVASFEALERSILTGGGSAAPLLSQQLMLMGNALSARYPERARFCYTWAKRFDTNQPWWLYKTGGVDFPRNVIATAPAFLSESANIIAQSWYAQLALVRGTWRFLGLTIFIFACAIFLVLATKYLPQGVHPIGDGLFGRASLRFRTVSSVIIVLSALIIGILPTLWVIAFLICRFTNAAEKKLLMLACALLALSPLDYYVTTFLQRGANHDSPPVLLERAIREGFSDDLHNMAVAKTREKPNNPTLRLALAVSASKQQDLNLGTSAINEALRLAPDDRMAQMYAGNISFLRGDKEGMERHYGSILRQHSCPRAKFNLAQAYVADGGFTSVDMITEAAQINRTLISEYMRVNENQFSGNPPPLRRVMQPSLTPGYFWGRLLLADAGEIFEAREGAAGVNPLAAFVVSALLLAILAAMNITLWNPNKPRARKYFVCRVCGRLICKKCRKGTLCADCHKACVDAHNNAAAMHNLQMKHQDSAQLRRDITKCVLGALVPGAGRLYKGESVVGPTLVMLVSSAIFAACYCAFTFTTAYPKNTVINPLYFVSVLLIYNLAAAIKQCVGLASTLKMRAKMSAKV